ncbi:MAG TPA: 4a-hydroxytetrahydrobiopterin dehydratase [Thermoanaerobaculia bacterium]|nr:4a-hydroxytetrahydrobiopterin dehydratase [Thermoanaerobaculia bacterium]
MNGSATHAKGETAPAKPVHIDEQLKAERIQSLLRQVPGWVLARHGAALKRRYSVPEHNTYGFVGFVGATAVGRGMPVELLLRGDKVTVFLPTRFPGGLTAAEFDLAKAIDDRDEQDEQQ